MSDGVFVLEGTSWREPRSVDRPLAISFIGDEKRSLFVPLGCQNDSTVRIAFEYPEQRGGFAAENRAGLLGAGWDVQRAALVPDLLDSISPEPGISMDITSMTRPMLAATVASALKVVPLVERSMR